MIIQSAYTQTYLFSYDQETQPGQEILTVVIIASIGRLESQADVPCLATRPMSKSDVSARNEVALCLGLLSEIAGSV